MAAHVFISYAHVDGDFVALLKLELEKAGFEVWVDNERLQVGEDWRLGIDDAIKTAFALVVVMSPEAFASNYVTYEWAFALGIGIKVVPIMLRSCPLHPRMEALQYLNFVSREQRDWERLSQRLSEIVAEFTPGMARVARDAPLMIKQAAAALDSHDAEVRKKAVESLAQIDHPMAQEVLANAVQHPVREIGISAALRLAEITRYKDSRAVPGLIEALSEKDEKISSFAAKALGKLRDERAIPALLKSLHHEDGRIRRIAANSLVRFSSLVVGDLVAELDDWDQRVREVATWALGEIKDTDAIPGLMKSLRDQSKNVYDAACDAILKIGTPAVDDLVEVLKDPDWTVRLGAIKLLGELGDVSSVPNLTAALEDFYSNIRTAAADALGMIGDNTAVPALLKALHDPNSVDVQCAAAKALGLIGDETAVEELAGILRANKPDDTNQTGEDGFGQGLNEMGSWNNKYLRKNVLDALDKIGTPAAVSIVRQWNEKPDGD